ncbi:MAG: Coenzyme F420 hydrogenase/dehydrogenase, beta subunit C-terminal domain, partial [Deltaproteobacteria bacterium]|nr:Coenzyme F420 hydrogenase/dehydrogenase, beta subunit C-terminal domain [Deltaproteobacteria bacterium]
MEPTAKGPKELFEEVIDQGLCTLCGACAGSCPYLVSYKGRIVQLDNCTRSEGECYQYCPRTQIDLDNVSRKIFDQPYSEEELGTFKEVLIARAMDQGVREKAQYGGVVTALISLAMDEGVIDRAILTATDDDKMPFPVVASNKEEALQSAGSSYMACSVLEAYNRLSSEDNDKIGIVGVPCQVLGLSKMKMTSPTHRFNIENVSLTIGLFCTWALSPDRFQKFLGDNLNLSSVTRFDIPPPPAERFDAHTATGCVSIGLDEVREFRMSTCAYCLDMTAEFADVSVGSAEGLEGWN